MKERILELHDVSFRYADGSRGLDNCSMAIGRGSRTAVLGANGAGKTTLFLHLNGILRPQAGQILCEGIPLDYSRQGLREIRSRVGLVFQNPDSQLFSASVSEDVSFGPMNMGLQRSIVRTRVTEALSAVGLLELADKPVHNLSYGQKKRVCIAGVLAMQPEVMILDEPMAGLDVPMQKDLSTILDGLHANGMSIVIATHDLDFAYEWADKLHFLEQGSLAASLEARDIPQSMNRLSAIGLGIPRVAELYKALTDSGLIEVAEVIPRSHEELMRNIRGSGYSKSSAVFPPPLSFPRKLVVRR